jgi:hypothetical protein
MTDQPDPDRTDQPTTDQPTDEQAPPQPAHPAPPEYADEIDQAAADSFPSSDPPSFTGSSSTRDPEDR